jgi:hypothetical protein
MNHEIFSRLKHLLTYDGMNSVSTVFQSHHQGNIYNSIYTCMHACMHEKEKTGSPICEVKSRLCRQRMQCWVFLINIAAVICICMNYMKKIQIISMFRAIHIEAILAANTQNSSYISQRRSRRHQHSSVH